MKRALIVTCLTVCVLGVSVVGADQQYWLSNVPDYYWYHGCSPTSGGAMFGYWDNQTGYTNLYDGTAPMVAGSGTDAIDGIISSSEHNSATYVNEECTHDNTPPTGDTGPNSIGCFMHTDPDTGGSNDWNIATGLRRYADYDDPDTTTNESYDFHSLLHYTASPTWPDWANDASFTFQDFAREIDAGRPVVLDCSLDGAGHSVVGYGYWIDDSDYWYAVRDTWQDAGHGADDYYGVTYKDDSGQEWWLWDLAESGDVFGETYFVDSGIYFIPNDDGPMEETSDYGDTFATAEPIEDLVETVYADLTSNDWDYYRIWMDEGDRIVAMTQDNEGYGNATNTYMRLYDPLGNYIVYSDDFWGGPGGTNTSHFFYTADETGWWRIAVHGLDPSVTGDYVLEVLSQPIPEPATIALFGLGLAGLGARLRRRRET